jgi:hypothetical protein
MRGFLPDATEGRTKPSGCHGTPADGPRGWLKRDSGMGAECMAGFFVYPPEKVYSSDQAAKSGWTGIWSNCWMSAGRSMVSGALQGSGRYPYIQDHTEFADSRSPPMGLIDRTGLEKWLRRTEKQSFRTKKIPRGFRMSTRFLDQPRRFSARSPVFSSRKLGFSVQTQASSISLRLDHPSK